MKLNARGDACYASAAGLFANKDTLDSRHATDACWFSDDEVACQHENAPGSPDWRVSIWDRRTGKSREVLPYGQNTVRAGNGTLGTWGDHGTQIIGVNAWPDAGLCDVSPEGRFVLTPKYQVGEGLDVYEANGTLLESIPTAGLGAASGSGWNVRLRGDVLLYQDRAGWHLRRVRGGELPLVPRTEGIALAVPVPCPNGRVAIIEVSDRFTIRYADSTIGISITTDDSFYPDAVLIDAVSIAYSATSGESPSSLARKGVTLAELDAATEDLNGAPPSSALVVPPIAAFPHAAYLGYFPYATSEGAAPGSFTGQNCRIDFTPHDGVFDNEGNKILSFVDTEYDMAHGMTVEQSINAKSAPRLVYWSDRFTRHPPPGGFWSSLVDSDIAACPLYRDPGESDEALHAAGMAQLDAADAYGASAVLVGGLWNRNNTLANQEVLDGGPVYRWLLDDADCAGLFFFGIGRGANAHPPQFVPEFQALADRFSVAGLPSYAPPPGGGGGGGSGGGGGEGGGSGGGSGGGGEGGSGGGSGEVEDPVIPDITGAEYEVFLDHRAQELIRAFSTRLHEELGGLSLADARAQANNACDYIHQACDKAGKARRIALPEEIQTICRIYWGERDTAATEDAIRSYCLDMVRLR